MAVGSVENGWRFVRVGEIRRRPCPVLQSSGMLKETTCAGLSWNSSRMGCQTSSQAFQLI